jgi:hypothetical protein
MTLLLHGLVPLLIDPADIAPPFHHVRMRASRRAANRALA